MTEDEKLQWLKARFKDMDLEKTQDFDEFMAFLDTPYEATLNYRDEIKAILLQRGAVNPKTFSGKEYLYEDEVFIIIDATDDLTLFTIGGMIHGLKERFGEIEFNVITPNSLPEQYRGEILRNTVLL